MTSLAAIGPGTDSGAPLCGVTMPAWGLRCARMDAVFEKLLRDSLPSDAGYASARFVEERSQLVHVRQGISEPVRTAKDTGVMFSVWKGGGAGYAATSDLTPSGLSLAAKRASEWAEITTGRSVLAAPPLAHPTGSYTSPVERPWNEVGLADRIALLTEQSERLAIDERIVERSARIWTIETDTLILTNGGGRVEQHHHQVFPNLSVVANEGSNTQTRSFGAGALGGQGGVEVLDRHGFADAAPRIAEEAIALLDAPNCPTGNMDLVLAPDQMALQIHESIGHPLELDRILGDERNYAGTTFVSLDMFGSYQYGSKLLNVTYDPTVRGEVASSAFDDDGTPSECHHLIRDGVLVRPLGGSISQERAAMDGVANSRASSWNRPPIDRMANLNVEPGTSTVEELIGEIEHGVLMETNVSWSIDDSRNKFQFGCELGRVISDGEIGDIVRNPNYRGISATFWRNLSGVADDFTVMGVANCGKGEPNQVIRVGHASPTCRFSDVAVFGGAK